jgi:tetratricopeptide (TPR) repeat protein
MALGAELPPDPAIEKRVGQLFLKYGMPKNAAVIYQKVVQKKGSDAEAYAGLGEAQLALDDFPAAQAAIRKAVRLDPENGTYQKRLQLVQQVIALDPAARRFHEADRFAASQKLLDAAVSALDLCLAADPKPVPETARALVDEGRKTLRTHGRPRAYAEAADAGILLAQRIWGERVMTCGAAGPAEEPLSRVMAHLAK